MLIGPRLPRRSLLAGGLAVASDHLVLAPLAAGAAGCASIAGDQDLHTFFYLSPDSTGAFSNWKEVNLGQTPAPGDSAIFVRASLTAPAGFSDLTFLTNVTASTKDPATGKLVPLVTGSRFPAHDTIGPLQIVYTQNIGPFFAGTPTIRINWSGQVNLKGSVPPAGTRIDALITAAVA